MCNASPIIALSKINCLTILPMLFNKIYIPEAVWFEITAKNIDNKMTPDLSNNVFERYEVNDQAAVKKLYGKLHYGEIEVMISAKELDVKDVILDDLAARKLAETLLLQPIGTVGILLLAKEEGIIKEVKLHLHLLIANNFRVSKKLYEQVIYFTDEL
ncbi:DUF3368 domain-containing protein [Salicibibacter kimchii]|uniref:DUF3368 domain-containing protein n=1 Tax=Salicibibacter kimchii TaxID=2099786 RepID=A0A345C131_9BACI|nr:DUF3368 domain-containing protein [Salicibibacter kimchii]AXF56912.1 DUF3368 domain-containing protein [Salicibibacter kimchii]